MNDNIQFLIDCIHEGFTPSDVLEFYLIDHEILLEGPPTDPYERAKYRIDSLMKRFKDDEVKAETHTLMRVKKTKDKAKLLGLAKAAKDYGFKDAAKEAKKKAASL